MNAVFHLRKVYRNLAIVCLLFFVGMMVMSICAFASDGETLSAVMFGGFWGCWVGLSLWMLLAYYRESLCIQGKTIIQKGVLRTKSVVLSELVDLQWRVPGAIVLRSKSEKIKIDFANYEPEERQRLIRLLHFSVPYAVQRGWDRFCHVTATHLWKDLGEFPLQEGDLLLTRQRYDRIFVRFLPVVAILNIGVAWYLHEARQLLILGLFVGLWLLVRATTPVNGVVMSKRLPSREKHDNRLLVWLAIWSAIGIGGVCLFNVFQNHLPYSHLWAWFGVLSWFCILLVYVYRTDRRRVHDEQGDIDLAVQRWKQYEALRFDSLNVTPKDDM